MITVKQLTNTSFEEIHEAFKNAFSDYVEPFNLSLEQLKYMLERRGCNLNLSFGAFNNNELIGFILNGIGYWNGELTAYDTGTGTVKEFRKKGVATKIFNDSLPTLHKYNISQYLLEVIRTNKGAYNLYRKAGFEVIREFEYYITSGNNITFRNITLSNNLSISNIEKPDWDLLSSFWSFNPSWQNSIDSINRKIQHFSILGIFDNKNLVGYGIIEKHTGDIPQIAIKKEYREKGLATSLVKTLLEHTESDEIKIINTCSEYFPFKSFAKSINLIPGHGQYEMMLKL